MKSLVPLLFYGVNDSKNSDGRRALLVTHEQVGRWQTPVLDKPSWLTTAGEELV
jgi:hypothetical protein